MNPNDPTASEVAFMQATANALIGLPKTAKMVMTANGTYRAGNRLMVVDFGPYDIGPIIGSNGGMKLALQTILAWPHNADNCQIRILSKRLVAPPNLSPASPTTKHLDAVLRAIADHLAPARFDHRTETSDTAVVAIVEADPMIARDLRGPISKLIRGIGRCQGYPAMVGLERMDSQSGRNARPATHAAR